MSDEKEINKEMKRNNDVKDNEKIQIVSTSQFEDLLNDKRKSIKRKYVSKSEEDNDSISKQWIKKKMIILDMLDVLDLPSTPSTKSNSLIDMKEMRENLLLMKGEVPTSYQYLSKRFHGCDLYLRQNYPNESLLKDINNYLSLSDLKLSFTEDHVASIVYLYAYKEKDDKKKTAYLLGRVQPRSFYEYSQLTVRLPSHKKETTTSQIHSFLSHSKNLNSLFDNMNKKEDDIAPSQREQQLSRHIQEYIDDCYQEYLQRTHQKECAHGRVPGFTMEELGKMPVAPLPPPLVIASPNMKEYLKRKS